MPSEPTHAFESNTGSASSPAWNATMCEGTVAVLALIVEFERSLLVLQGSTFLNNRLQAWLVRT